MSGSKHIEFLLEKKLVTSQPLRTLDEIYSSGQRPFSHAPTAQSVLSSKEATENPDEERMLLHRSTGRRIAETLEVAELEMELDRAVWQVEKALKAAKELKEEKSELDSVNAESEAKK